MASIHEDNSSSSDSEEFPENYKGPIAKEQILSENGINPVTGQPMSNVPMSKAPDGTDIEIKIDISGVSYDEMRKLPYNYQTKSQVRYCYSCDKYFPTDYVVQYNTTGYVSEDDWMCYHCLYWINYGLEQRSLVDGVFGKSIAEYILECKDTHNTETCNRNCFICDHLAGLDIELIQHSELLNGSKESMDEENRKLEEDLFTVEI